MLKHLWLPLVARVQQAHGLVYNNLMSMSVTIQMNKLSAVDMLTRVVLLLIRYTG